MIKYALKCRDDHRFSSWFQSANAFEKLRKSGMLTCPSCGVSDVEKAIMAPQVQGKRKAVECFDDAQLECEKMHALSAPDSAAEAAMNELKNKIQEHSEYVGSDFANEARAIHDGDAPERSIYGEASGEEAKKLVKDGVPVAPLPFMPTRKTN